MSTSGDASRSRAPRPKLAAAGIAGALTTILVYVLGLVGVEVTSEVAAALTAVIAFIAGYFWRED